MNGILKTIRSYKKTTYTLYLVLASCIFSLAVIKFPYFPYPKEALRIFFVNNDRIFDVYIGVLGLIAALSIPFIIKVLESLERREFLGLTLRIFFEQVIRISRFYILIPLFSLFSLFLIKSDCSVDEDVLIFIHGIGLFLWVSLLWALFDSLKKVIDMFSDSEEIFNRLLFDFAKGTMAGDQGMVRNQWESVFKITSKLKEEWRRKFLSLFWKKQKEFFDASAYHLVTDLFVQFANTFLSLQTKERKDAVWMNTRKHWLWFHEETFNKGKQENPYAVFRRLLAFYRLAHKQWSIDLKNGDGRTFEQGVDNLQDTLHGIVERLVTNELETTDDYYFSLFKSLSEHMHLHTQKDSIDKSYILSLPIYNPVFEHAHLYMLNEYKEGRGDTGFPNEWRVLAGKLDDDNLLRNIWLNKFREWAQHRIDHGREKWDDKLNGAVEMLFPETDTSWIALALGYAWLSYGKSRVDSLCQWQPNFGTEFYGSPYSYTSYQSEEEIAKRMKEQQDQEVEVVQNNTARIIKRLKFFGEDKDVQFIRTELETLEGKYEKGSYQERNRLRILELINKIGQESVDVGK